MSAPPLPAHFAVLLPVKPPALGKSRLVGLPDDHRRDLAAAFALDTVAAALATPAVAAVLAVTDDFRFAAELRALGADVVPDGVTGDLNGSLVQAALEAQRRWPDLRLAAVCADLPSLRSDELAAALAGVPTDRAAFVADAVGTGTTMYAADAAQFAPRFGPDSRALHLEAGAVELAGDLLTLRHDVDDVADLSRALVLGVGAHTAAVTGRR